MTFERRKLREFSKYPKFMKSIIIIDNVKDVNDVVIATIFGQLVSLILKTAILVIQK